MNEIKTKCERYLKYKYYYYCVGQPLITDFEFDKFEKELRDTNDELALKVVDLVDFPSIDVIESLGFNLDNIAPEVKSKRDETKRHHYSKMLSIQKIQVNDPSNLPYHSLELFLNRQKADYYEASLKYDGNSMNCIYKNGKLVDALTRGDGKVGLSKLNKMRLIVPNTINIDGIVEIRGEVLIRKKLFRSKYATEGKIENERNWVAGVISKEDIDIKQFSDLTFVAYSLVKIVDGEEEYIENAMETLYENGFNNSYKPETIKMNSIDDFEKIYNHFSKYKEESEFLIDGLVLKFPEKFRSKMGDNNHYWKWCVAIKFPPTIVSTTIEDIQWELGKDGHLVPIGILKPVELGGTVVSRVSLHNIGYIIKNKTFKNCKIALVKSGEIIPMVKDVLEASPNAHLYIKEFMNFSDNNSK